MREDTILYYLDANGLITFDVTFNGSNMKKIGLILIVTLIVSCKKKENFVIVFASCNDQDREQPLWKPILENKPDLFIWGGDNIYADTDDMQKMRSDYNKVHANPDYAALLKSTTVIGTWDDHDYGKNDAGKEWEKKEEAKQLFWDFLRFPKEDPLRLQEGVYYSRKYEEKGGSIKVILLDTRTFRDSLQKSTVEGRRFEPWEVSFTGTILGKTQWNWLEEELKDTSADFNVIVSSIQFIADEHGWEKWGNFPSEVEKMKNILGKAKSKNILFVSGDRHLAEFSTTKVDGLDYELIDFTTSGLTHTYPDSPDEPNPYRVGKLVKELNFGLIKFDFETKKVSMEIRGMNNLLFDKLERQY